MNGMTTQAKTQKEFYDSAYQSELFAQHCQNREQNAFLAEHVARILGKSAGDGILEVGSGNGLLTEILLHRGGRVHAVDISQKGIESLKSRLDSFIRSAQLRVTAGDATELLEASDEEYDLIIGSGVLHHIEDVPRFLKAARNRLKPGGSVVFLPEPNANGILGYIWRYVTPYIYRVFGIAYDWEVEKGTLNIKSKYLLKTAVETGFSSSSFYSYQVIPHFRMSMLRRLDSFLRKFRVLTFMSLYVGIVFEAKENSRSQKGY